MFLLVASLFGSAEVLSSVSKCKKAVVYLTPEKTNVSDKLRSGMSSCTIGHEFNVNESIIYIK